MVRHLVRGSAWAIATRWALRAIGLVSTVVLARLLTPEDFGVAATGALTIGFIQGFAELGTQQLVIREREMDRRDFDTAWTFQILQGVFVGFFLLLIAPVSARYFGDERAVDVIRLLSVSAMLGGATNIGLVLAQKNLNFAIEFKFRTIERVLSFFVTLGLALWLRSYWALVISTVVTAALSVPLSFAMHPYRPRLCLASMRKYFRFASAIVPMRIGRYFNSKADVMVVGGVAGTAMLGAYNVAAELAGMLTNEILTPVGRGLLPGYAKLSHDPARYAQTFRYVLGSSATVIFPVGFGLSIVAPQVVELILGDQWVAAIPIVQTLAIYYMITALLHMMSAQVLIASGHERRSALAVWVRVATLVPAVVIAGTVWGAETVAGAALVSAFVSTPFVVVILTRSIALSVRDVVLSVTRPLLAALVMNVGLIALSEHLVFGAAVKLAVEVLAGAAIYFAFLWILWLVSGRPNGLERAATDFASRKLFARPT